MTTKILGNQITSYTIDTVQLSNTATAAFAKTLAPKVLYANVASNTFTVLDDTAVNVGGGYIVVTGAEFQSGAQVLIDTTPASAVTYVNSTTLRVQVPTKAASSYNLYVVNPDGGVGIKVAGITYSSEPTWVTTSPLANVTSNTVFSGNVSATGATSYANTTILPTGFNLLANGYYFGNISVGAATTYSFDLRATDNELQDSNKTFSLSAILGAPSDPYYSYTGVILKADSSPFVDNSFHASAITNSSGTPTELNTTTKKYGSGSARFYRNASTSLSVATNNNLDLASTFTMEAWVYLTGHPSGLNSICGKWGGSNYSYLFALSSSGSMETTQLNVYFNEGSTGPSFTFSTPTLNTGGWYHIAVVRNGSSLLAFLNGIQVGSTQSYSGTPATRSGPLTIGSAGADGHHFDGFIDDLRITRGIARYTTTFTPPDSVPTA
jgi:hypothetical protein